MSEMMGVLAQAYKIPCSELAFKMGTETINAKRVALWTSVLE